MEQSWKYGVYISATISEGKLADIKWVDEGDIEEMLRYTGLDGCFTYTDAEGAYDLRVLTQPESKTPRQFGALKAYFDQKIA